MPKKRALRYFDMGPFPVYFGVCFEDAAFRKEMARLGITEDVALTAKSAACHFLTNGAGQSVILIALDVPAARGKSRPQVAALLAHEASHAADQLFSDIGEDCPGAETRAYLVQHFTQCALQALEDYRKR